MLYTVLYYILYCTIYCTVLYTVLYCSVPGDHGVPGWSLLALVPLKLDLTLHWVKLPRSPLSLSCCSSRSPHPSPGSLCRVKHRLHVWLWCGGMGGKTQPN